MKSTHSRRFNHDTLMLQRSPKELWQYRLLVIFALSMLSLMVFLFRTHARIR